MCAIVNARHAGRSQMAQMPHPACRQVCADRAPPLTEGTENSDHDTMPIGGPEGKAAPSRERRGHFRGKPRPGRRVALTFRILENGQPGTGMQAMTKNIGVGGAFVLTTDPAPPGSSLVLEVAVASGKNIAVRGDVRWIVDGKHDEPEREFGMGVKFAPLDVEQLLSLSDYFATLSGGELVEHDEA